MEAKRTDGDRGRAGVGISSWPAIVRMAVLGLAAGLVLGGVPVAEAQDYIVRVTYGGQQSLYRAEVLLYDTDRACDTLVVDPTDPPSPDVAWAAFDILPNPEGEFPDRGVNVPAGIELHYAVARGEPSDGGGGGAGFFATFGCIDGIPPVSPSGPVVLDIPMEDMPSQGWAAASTVGVGTEGGNPDPGRVLMFLVPALAILLWRRGWRGKGGRDQVFFRASSG